MSAQVLSTESGVRKSSLYKSSQGSLKPRQESLGTYRVIQNHVTSIILLITFVMWWFHSPHGFVIMFKPRLNSNDPLHYKKQWSTYYRSLCLHPFQPMPLNILVSKEEFIRLLK